MAPRTAESLQAINRFRHGEKSPLKREERVEASDGPWKTPAGEGHSRDYTELS